MAAVQWYNDQRAALGGVCNTCDGFLSVDQQRCQGWGIHYTYPVHTGPRRWGHLGIWASLLLHLFFTNIWIIQGKAQNKSDKHPKQNISSTTIPIFAIKLFLWDDILGLIICVWVLWSLLLGSQTFLLFLILDVRQAVLAFAIAIFWNLCNSQHQAFAIAGPILRRPAGSGTRVYWHRRRSTAGIRRRMVNGNKPGAPSRLRPDPGTGKCARRHQVQ